MQHSPVEILPTALGLDPSPHRLVLEFAGFLQILERCERGSFIFKCNVPVVLQIALDLENLATSLVVAEDGFHLLEREIEREKGYNDNPTS